VDDVVESSDPGLKVGLEVHQQLSTPTKLFCACPPAKSEELPCSFERRLRPAQSETGRVDPAALFEFSKGKANLYLWNPESACLVEADEEPPHPASEEAIGTALQVSNLLESSLVDEVHVMRKIVIDGSNTAGFQRTAVLGLGGRMSVGGVEVGVQSVTLEEDAARILGDDNSARRFALDRLGVPLVEVALDPVVGTPEFVGSVALHLGRTLRSTGRVARGLGTIRQDLNISVKGGAVVEVKGVQKLNLVAKVVSYELDRQLALDTLGKRIQERGLAVKCKITDVSEVMEGTGSRVIIRILREGGSVACVSATGLKGLLGWEPSPGIRLGREVAEVARAGGLGGVIHSDEFRKQGILKEEETALRKLCAAGEDSTLVLVAGQGDRVKAVANAIAERLEQAAKGVPAETRAATDAGETVYMRPRPGAQRMYPETDIPQIALTRARIATAKKSVPTPWETAVRRYQESYSLSYDLALRLYDSEYAETFEKLSHSLKISPSIIASTLVELPVRLSRERVPAWALEEEVLMDLLGAMDSGKVAKEMAPDLLRVLGSGKARTVEQAIGALSLYSMQKSELSLLIDSIIGRSGELIGEKGEAAFSPLMGEVMAVARGRADGGLVSRILKEKLSAALKKVSRV